MAQAIRPVMLVILDGFGWREETADNAVRLARTPTFKHLWQTCPHAFLRTSGRDVGLPAGQMGNSEVGHNLVTPGMQYFHRNADVVTPDPVHKVLGSNFAWVGLAIYVELNPN